MVGLTGEMLVDRLFHDYQGYAAKHGRDLALGEGLALNVGFYLADTQEEAMERVRKSHDERYKWFAPFGFVRYTDEQGRAWGTPGAPARLPHIEDGVQQKAWICGPASTVRLLPEGHRGEIPRLGAHRPALARRRPLGGFQRTTQALCPRGYAHFPKFCLHGSSNSGRLENRHIRAVLDWND